MAASLLVTGLAACTPLPTSTYTNAAGQEVTVNWRDYPAHAGNDGAEILMAPVKEDTEALGERLLLDITDALAAEFGLAWTTDSPSGWFPTEGNGYGGQSMTTTYNSASWTSDGIPAAPSDWTRIVSVINKRTTAAGLGSVVFDQDRPDFRTGVAWEKDLVERFGSTDPNKFYVWYGTAYSASQWLSVQLLDVERDQRGKAAQEYEKHGWAGQGIHLSYGATTISRDQQSAFKEALAPFEGLEKPEATTSD